MSVMGDRKDLRSIPELIGELTDEMTVLLRREARLLRSEFSDKVAQIGAGLGEIAAGAICLLTGLLILLQAIVIALTNLGLGAGWSALIVGGAVGVLGAALLVLGSKNSKPKSLVPERSARQLSDDAEMLKEQLR